MPTRLLQIEDDLRLAAMVREYLEPHGFALSHAADASQAMRLLASEPFDAVLLDLMLPDADGLDVCRKIRSSHLLPVVMITARGDLSDRVVGLELGADDYLAKPFEPRELLARLRAVLRRTQLGREMHSAALVHVGDLVIDPGTRSVTVRGEPRSLTAHQFDLLLALAMHPGQVMSREQLLSHARGQHLEAFDRSIDVHVGKIRQAIEDDPHVPTRLLTVRGVGYVLAKQAP
jgi:DNA-binding response OmpR family regulator